LAGLLQIRSFGGDSAKLLTLNDAGRANQQITGAAPGWLINTDDSWMSRRALQSVAARDRLLEHKRGGK